MKKHLIAVLCIISLSAINCKKAEGNKNVITEENIETKITTKNGELDSTTTLSQKKIIDGKVINTTSYTFRATDGSRAKVTFTNAEKSHTIAIEANNHKFQLDQVSASKNSISYERNGIKAVSKGDSLQITQGNNVIELVRDR